MIRMMLATLRWIGLTTLAVAAMGGTFLATQYDGLDDLSRDTEAAYDALRVALYRQGLIDELSPREVRQVYQRSCYRRCHGEAVMLTTILSPAGWIQVVERMRVKEGVDISGREANAIIQYLEEEYPAIRSPYTFAVRKQTHDAVWRNDDGGGNIYGDVIYATPEYLRSIGMASQIEEYNVRAYHVFIVSLTVHEGTVPQYDMDAISSLSVDGGPLTPTAPPWELRFETADRHHYEAMIRFPRARAAKESLTLHIRTVGGRGVRTYVWELPLPYPSEIQERSTTGDRS